MRHVVEFKLPKLFGKKKIEEAEIAAEVEVEEKIGKLSTAVTIGGTLVVGITVGYLAGFNRGAVKVLNGIVIVTK